MTLPAQEQCDLHIHSIFSDSDARLEEIFAAARLRGLRCIAITDHDSMQGAEEASRLSQAYALEAVSGIELSAQCAGSEVHVLGYFTRADDSKFKAALSNARELRLERLWLMTERLGSLGVKVDKQELLATIAGAIPTRLHLALYLIKKGQAANLKDAFRRYLACGRPAYVAHFKYSVPAAIQLIKESGGLAFLAHPHYLPQRSWIEDFAARGLDGLEVVYPGLSPAATASYSDTADRLGLLKSGGSDAHGSYKEFTRVGGVTIPYAWVEAMKSRLALVPSVE